MDVGERLFLSFAKLRARMSPRAEPASGVVRLRECADRLRTLRAMLAGADLEIRPIAGVGGNAGRALLLPESIGLGTAGENESIYISRVVYSVACEALGLGLPEGVEGEEAALLSLRAVQTARGWISQHLPGAVALDRQASALELARRDAPPPRPERPADLLEWLSYRQLGGGAGSSLAPAESEWIGRALDPSPAPELIHETARLWSELATLLPRRSRRPAALPVIWPVLLPADRSRELADRPPGEPRSRTDGRSQSLRLEKTVKIRREASRKRPENPLFHSFEKTESLEDYAGQSNAAEDTVDVESEADSLSELAYGHVVRTLEESQAAVQVQVVRDGAEFLVESADSPGPEVVLYPEWNWKTGSYRSDWCRVVEDEPEGAPAGVDPYARARQLARESRREVEEIRRQLIRHLTRKEQKTRQLEGPQFDLERIVERHADLMAGRTPPDRLYLNVRREPRDVALLVLFDRSLSTDGWVEGRRVLDIEVRSLIMLSDAFSGLLDEAIAVAGFSSRTRSECHFTVFKRFEEHWQRMRRTLPHIEPSGFTRIGPAIRHATAQLKSERARTKVLLLVTDGKPADYDQYEGTYGIQDVAQAIREAKQWRIRPFALAIEKESKQHLAQMFGPGQYRVLNRATELPHAMLELFSRAVA